MLKKLDFFSWKIRELANTACTNPEDYCYANATFFEKL